MAALMQTLLTEGAPARPILHGRLIVYNRRTQVSRPSSMRAWPSAPSATVGSWVAMMTAAPRSASRTEEVEDAFAVAAVELAGGLVGQDHPALLGDPAGDRDPLLFTTGELLDEVVAAVLQADLRSAPPRSPVELVRGLAAGEQRHRQVLAAP